MQLPKIELRMFLIKQLINRATPHLTSLSQDVNPESLQSKIILRVWQRLEDTLEKEVKTGVFSDNNFKNLLIAAKNVLIFLCEHDNYYRRWLGLLIRFIAEEYAKAEADFNLAQAKTLPVKPLGLTETQFEQHKPSLWECALTGYLHGLSLAPKNIVDTIVIARNNKGFVDLPSIDANAFYRIHFDGFKSCVYNLMFREGFKYGNSENEKIP